MAANELRHAEKAINVMMKHWAAHRHPDFTQELVLATPLRHRLLDHRVRPLQERGLFSVTCGAGGVHRARTAGHVAPGDDKDFAVAVMGILYVLLRHTCRSRSSLGRMRSA